MTVASQGTEIPLDAVEQELTRQFVATRVPGEPETHRARMSNLVIFCDSPAAAEEIEGQISEIVAIHPARVLLLVGDAAGPGNALAATVNVCYRESESSERSCSERVTIRAHGYSMSRLPFAVRGLLVGDLPTNLWWVSTQPPAMGGSLLYELTERAQQIIYDSNGWAEPAGAISVMSSWLSKFEKQRFGSWRVASDLNWRRLKYWRRLMSQALNPASAPGALESITEVVVEHGPHSVVQAFELVGWMASRLHWTVQAGQVKPGVEISWNVRTPRGQIRLRIRRLPQGPAVVQRVRIACALDGKPGALNFVLEDNLRLTVVPEGVSTAPRTLMLQSHSLAELVGRQLSDREYDPVFGESMAVAQQLAQSIAR